MKNLIILLGIALPLVLNSCDEPHRHPKSYYVDKLNHTFMSTDQQLEIIRQAKEDGWDLHYMSPVAHYY
ncbi:hypothetical protein PEPS_02610 [Persicobacter psychrovividus]|uniref:Uncharacterized protein n=1 Tax=Persicobacter psychrovividus TaxID=387638 RepID=A0ABM7VAN6_9BACT|nr:hypothetical protein PEPS_02610 [Persicobacter psychrovividus]